jgi:Peptidase A4 family
MPAKELANGLSVRTFQTPRADFDLGTATDRERAVYGFPRCPVEFKDLEKRWEAKARRFRIVEPTFEPRELRRRRLPGLNRDHPTLTSDIWSGGITFPPQEDTIKWVEGTWSMPDVGAPPGGRPGDLCSASTWIGIDGDGSSADVLQAGCDAYVVDMPFPFTAPVKQFAPWWEWYPAGSFWITSMTVSPGDELTCLICLDAGSKTVASIFLGNVTTSVGHFFTATAPGVVQASGNCAEWIVEALENQDGVPELAKYTTVEFTECSAGTIGGKTVLANSGINVNMVNASGAVVSEGELLGPNQVQVSFV